MKSAAPTLKEQFKMVLDHLYSPKHGMGYGDDDRDGQCKVIERFEAALEALAPPAAERTALKALKEWCQERRDFFEEQWRMVKYESKASEEDKLRMMQADELAAWQYKMVIDKIDASEGTKSE